MNPSQHAELMRSIGQIEGKLDGLHTQVADLHTTTKGVDTRLRAVETRSTVNAGVVGGLVGLGTSLLAAKIKSTLGV